MRLSIFGTLLLSFLIWLIFFSGFPTYFVEKLEGEVNEISDSADEIVIEKFDRDRLVQFEVTGKHFGENSSRFDRWRVNYFGITSESVSYDVAVPIEIYNKYEIGDTIPFYIDDKSKDLLHVSEVLVRVVE